MCFTKIDPSEVSVYTTNVASLHCKSHLIKEGYRCRFGGLFTDFNFIAGSPNITMLRLSTKQLMDCSSVVLDIDLRLTGSMDTTKRVS